MSSTGSIINWAAIALKCIAPLLIILVTALAVVWVASIRRKRLTRKFHLQIRNAGNIASRYQLRADDPTHALVFKFFMNGNLLPNLMREAPVTYSPVIVTPQAAASVPQSNPVKTGGDTLQKASSFGGAVGALLTSIGSFLPRSIGAPFYKAGSKLYAGQMKVSYAQQVGQRAQAVAPSKPSNPQPSSTPVTIQQQVPVVEQGPVWAETPAINPGDTVVVEMVAQSTWLPTDQEVQFKVISKSVEGEKSPEVVEAGQMLVRGGFLSHRFWPQALILFMGLAFLAAALWFAFGGNIA